jgi:hypothetical protein
MMAPRLHGRDASAEFQGARLKIRCRSGLEGDRWADAAGGSGDFETITVQDEACNSRTITKL